MVWSTDCQGSGRGARGFVTRRKPVLLLSYSKCQDLHQISVYLHRLYDFDLRSIVYPSGFSTFPTCRYTALYSLFGGSSAAGSNTSLFTARCTLMNLSVTPGVSALASAHSPDMNEGDVGGRRTTGRRFKETVAGAEPDLHGIGDVYNPLIVHFDSFHHRSQRPRSHRHPICHTALINEKVRLPRSFDPVNTVIGGAADEYTIRQEQCFR